MDLSRSMWNSAGVPDSYMGGPSQSEQELEHALRESLRVNPNPQLGNPLHQSDMQRIGLYFEHQHPSSDTCGLNALNNICQKKMFKIENLQSAEAQMAREQEGGQFAQVIPVQNAPKGFFDVEALKIAAKTVDLEIVDVEPVLDFQRSRCSTFVEAARNSSDAGWFLGFLVYDRRPGQMHYYTLRRDGRYKAWVKLDSQLPREGEEVKNRWLTEDNLRALYEASKLEFRDWLMRWFPVVYRAGAAKEVCRIISAGGYEVSTPRALSALRECGWVVTQTTNHLLHDLPQVVRRELLVKVARPSEVEMRSLLEAAQWDVSRALPGIYQALQSRANLVQNVETGTSTRNALSLSDWEPSKAATLLALSLRIGCGMDALGDLHHALMQVNGDVDRAEGVLRLQSKHSMSMTEAVSLLQLGTWSLEVAERILQVRRRFPGADPAVCLEVLRRNDDDPHAAGEYLAEYKKRIQRTVAENSTGDLIQGEEVPIAESALNSTDWDPNRAFVAAKHLAFAVQQTRQLIRSKGYKNHFAVDVLLPALTAGDLKAHAAASYLLGMRISYDGLGRHAPPSHIAAASATEGRERRPSPDEEEEESMCVMT